MATAHVIVSGLVQGVWYRQSTAHEATRLGVSGWVQNLADGRVEAWLEGPREALETLITWCRRGPERARVTEVEVVWHESVQGLVGFEVRR